MDKKRIGVHIKSLKWYCVKCQKDFDLEVELNLHECEDLKDED